MLNSSISPRPNCPAAGGSPSPDGSCAPSGHSPDCAIFPERRRGLPFKHLTRLSPARPRAAKSSSSSSQLGALELLGLRLTCRKQSTSHFLIDNFQRSPVHVFPLASDFKPRISASSNRQSPQLELPLSCRKQRIGCFLIAKFRPMLPSPNLFSVAKLDPRGNEIPDSQLSAVSRKLSSLIASETLSRKESTHCKQSICKILIANEFQSSKCSRLTKNVVLYRITDHLVRGRPAEFHFAREK